MRTYQALCPLRGASALVRLWTAFLLCLASLLAPQLARAQDAAIPEEQVKAAFLFNFIRFVEWPAAAFPSEKAPITLGVFGNDDFAARLTTLLKEKKAHGRSFEVKKLTAIADAADCQLVFVANFDARRTAQLADYLKRRPVLLVGESEDFLDHGGIINFVRDDKQLRFDINSEAASDRKLTISSHLLRLARKTK